MKLTNEQIEQILNDAPEDFEHYDLDFKVYTKVTDEKLCYFSSSGLLLKSDHSRPMHYLSRESSRLHKRELELMLKAGNLESEILSLRKELEQAKKELEQVINEESDGIDGVV